MANSESTSDTACIVCRRGAMDWFIRVTIEDRGELQQQGFICSNCGIKLRLTSENMRDLQIDPWVHAAMAKILRGRDSGSE